MRWQSFSRTAIGLFFCAVVFYALGGASPPNAMASATGVYSGGTAIDTSHVYWIRSKVTGYAKDGSPRARRKLMQRNIRTGTERVIFSTSRSRIDGLHAGAGRVTFTSRFDSENRRRKTFSSFDRIYAMNADDVSPTLIAKLGGTMRVTDSTSGFELLCLGFGYGKNVSEDGTILALEYPNTCRQKNPPISKELVGYRPDGSRTVLAGDEFAFYAMALSQGKLYSFDGSDTSVTDPSTGVTTKSPFDDWIEYLDFEADRALAVRSDDSYDYRSAYIWFDPGTLNPIRRVVAKRGQLLQPRICESGYVVATGHVRNVTTSKTYQQPLGKGPYVATFYTFAHEALKRVRLPTRGISSLDCAGDNLILIMDGKKKPMIKIIPFGWRFGDAGAAGLEPATPHV